MNKQQEFKKQTKEAKFGAFSLMCRKVADLEKENADLERKLEQTEKDLADYQFNYSTIKELEKENAELKDKLDRIERKCKFNFVDLLHDVENESKQEEQLTNAKEIIKALMKSVPYGAGKMATEAYDKAEQFLNSEVEK